jgi:FKBP-type peptidyl-prolyl cis-trans isomerase FkpA
MTAVRDHGKDLMTRALRLALILTIATAWSLPGVACAKQAEKAAAPASADLQTEEQKVLYALGVFLGKNVANLNITPAELEFVKRGVGDGATGAKPAVDLEEYQKRIQTFAESRMKAQALAEEGKARGYREAAAKEAGALTTSSGLVFASLKEGTGVSPSPSDVVRVHYRGTLTDGQEFDNSYKRGEPTQFPVRGVIPCWTEALQRMKVGGKAKLVCPASIAYGEQGRPPVIPGGATLVFEVELLGIVKN